MKVVHQLVRMVIPGLLMLAGRGAVAFDEPLAGPLLSCPDYFLSEQDLSDDLYRSARELRWFFRKPEVRIDPAGKACYLRVRVEAKGGLCTLEACTVAISSGTRIGVPAFEINGCETARSLFGVPDHFRERYFERTGEEITRHCGSASFVIQAIVPEQTQGQGGLRVRLVPAPLPSSPPAH